jgi:hypothetical protein
VTLVKRSVLNKTCCFDCYYLLLLYSAITVSIFARGFFYLEYIDYSGTRETIMEDLVKPSFKNIVKMFLSRILS